MMLALFSLAGIPPVAGFFVNSCLPRRFKRVLYLFLLQC
jgi:formate hydrogenlyase subunit 3/multisubunit Na+/H+ antiporter MnhD subunit